MWYPSFNSFYTNHSTKDEAILKDLQSKIMLKIENEMDSHVEISNSMINNEINEWHFHNPAAQIQTPTLLIHGYAASSMAYHRTFKQLSSEIQDLYAIDLPSNGLSTRPTMPKPITTFKPLRYKMDKEAGSITIIDNVAPMDQQLVSIRNYEDFYIERIEHWRKSHGIDKFNIVGHSFGGYMTFKYALKYPQRIENLCLISPLGVERSVHSIHNQFQRGDTYTVTQEDTTSNKYLRGFTIPAILFNNQLNALRWMGPVGAHFARSHINSRYARVPGTEYQDYLYQIFYGSREFPKQNVQALTNLFSRQLTARDPLLDNIKTLQVKNVMMMYGEEDWMDRVSGYHMASSLGELGHNAKFVEVPDAGHNIFLDNPSGFNKHILQFLS